MEEYVTIELAKKLKEKGFPQGNKDDMTGRYYTSSDILTLNGEETKCDCPTLSQIATLCYARVSSDERWYCPTISQVLKWLRDEKKLYILPNDVLIKDNIKWDFQIDDLNTSDIIYESRLIYSSYEEAILTGIEYVLDNLIKHMSELL